MGLRTIAAYPKHSERFGVTWRMDGAGEYTAEHEHQDYVVISIDKELSWGGPMKWNGSIVVVPARTGRATKGHSKCIHWQPYKSLAAAQKDIAELMRTDWYWQTTRCSRTKETEEADERHTFEDLVFDIKLRQAKTYFDNGRGVSVLAGQLAGLPRRYTSDNTYEVGYLFEDGFLDQSLGEDGVEGYLTADEVTERIAALESMNTPSHLIVRA